ncbi:zinc finger protein [Theobroma cacao]|nr:zinc finger protein [Theobroma cacao]
MRKKKSIALKASILEKELEELSCDDDEDLALVARKFRKLMSRRNRRLTRRGFRKDQGASWKIKNKNDFNKKEKMICYKCKRPGHFKSECPLLKDETPKKNKRSKKAMVATVWSDNDKSSSETDDEKSEKRANICLMAQENETKDEYECLYDEFEKLFSKYKSLKKKVALLENDLEQIKQEFTSVFKQRNILQVKLEHSKTDFEFLKQELEKKSEALQITLDDNTALKCLKNGSSKRYAYHNKYSAKALPRCYNCGKHGHLSYDYFKKRKVQKVKKILVPKGSFAATNTQEPIKMWVPIKKN